jgi:AcrR family transcriptional regulator
MAANAREPLVLDGASSQAATPPSTRDRVLAVAIAQLEAGGEALVRIDEIRDRSGVSIGSIYHHFGDRDGVIVAAQLRRFSQYAEAEVAELAEIVRRSRNLSEFRKSIRELTRRSQSEFSTGVRWGRLGVLGSLIGREALREEIRAIQTTLTDGFQAHVAKGQARGFFRPDLDPRAVAAFIEAYSLGAVLNDLDLHGVTERAWEKVVWAVLEGLLVDP